MANQTGVLRGKSATGPKSYDFPVLVVDTDETLAQFPNLGTATEWIAPEDVIFSDFTLAANTATVTQLIPIINQDRKASKTLLTVFLANATTGPSTRFGAPFKVLRGTTFQLIGT